MAAIVSETYARLIDKYDCDVVMYTAYPHHSHWSKEFGDKEFRTALKDLFSCDKSPPLMLYLHIPHCEELCWFCTCHITVTHSYEKVKKYLSVLHREVDLFRDFLDQHSLTPNFQEVHFGGGSPTYICEDEFEQLMERVRTIVDIDRLSEFSIEIDPRRVDKERLKFYHEKGVNRISLGVQDFDLDVQKAINRVQPPELIENLLAPEIKKCFVNGINFDIICGLPRQTPTSIRETINKVVDMSPDRICLNYLHLSKFAKHQKLMNRSELPSVHEKKMLFYEALDVLERSGYVRIGYDHFAKPTDAVAKALVEQKMHWNALGYTSGKYASVIGLGISSYSTVGENYYFQNCFDEPDYEKAITKGHFPIYRGYKLDQDDIMRRDIITRLRSYFYLDCRSIEEQYGINFEKYFGEEKTILCDFAQENIIELSNTTIVITESGKQFANLVCETFDRFVPRYKHLRSMA